MTAPGEPINVEVLAKAVSAVATAGFGRDVRKGTDTDELDEIVGALVADSSVPKVAQYEEALQPSITRIGKGRYGRLARGIFGLTPETEGLPYRYQRQERLEADLHIKEHALKADLDKMFRVLAEDLVVRFNSLVAQ